MGGRWLPGSYSKPIRRALAGDAWALGAHGLAFVAGAVTIVRLSVGLTRGTRHLGLTPGSPPMRAVMKIVRAIADAAELPGPVDFETEFRPGRAFVRRVGGRNLWVLYRFDARYVDVLTVRDQPPVPVDYG